MPIIRCFYFVFWFLGACLLGGCGGTVSLIEKGQRIQTGKGRLDGYFGEVLDLREKVNGLDSDLFPLRQPLTEAYGLNVDTPLATLMVETRKRLESYKSFGVAASLRLTPNPIVLVVQGELSQDEADEVTLKAIQEAAVRSLATYREYAQFLEVAMHYDEQRTSLLEQVAKSGSEASDHAKLENEILGAGRVLAGIEGKLLKDMRTCSLMLVALSEAVDTGGGSTRDANCEEALAHWKPAKPPRNGGKRTGGSGPAPRGARAPAGPAPAPVPPPKKPAGDFDQ